jgi:hypothetical protein
MPDGGEGFSISSHQRFEDTIAHQKTMIEGRYPSFFGREDFSVDPDVGGQAHSLPSGPQMRPHAS